MKPVVTLLLGALLGALTPAASPASPANFAIRDSPKALPDIRFTDGEGQALSLSDFRGKAVALNVWATWCGPCRHEMPTFDRLQKALGGPDFQVVALSIDRKGPDVVRRFYREIDIRHLDIHVDSSGKASRDLGVVGLPVTLLIDRAGREIARLVGPAEWDTPEMIAFIRHHLDLQVGARPPIDPR